ncbi:MAG TPA: amino acid adenylation domain-containing protein, partial [Longimicrobiaceae bacterium]|nr:amino acid adenylation domain-containing protein [Longimicrobiaceae bacterium]
PALLTGAGALSYRELDAASNSLARALQDLTAVRGKTVAIVADRGAPLVQAAYAVLKAGAAYVPLDPSLPADRCGYVLADCEAAAVLAEERHARALEWPAGLPVLAIEDAAASWAAHPVEEEAPVEPSELAYLIYTSGSTGRPKGVMIEHSGAVNTIVDVNERFGVGPADRVFGVSSFGFDLSVYDLFGTAAAGAALVYPDPEQHLNPSHWLDVVQAQGVTVWNSAPPLALLLVETAEARGATLPELRLVMMSGDWIPVDLPDRIRRVAPGARVVSLGGATEASIWSICYEIGEVDPAWPSIPYGYPMQNQPWHVLDEWGRPAPDWTAGELYIGGDGLARGYWNDPEKTAAAFVRHPATGERIYRTGDVGRYLPGGVIEFLGRRDSQVKIQGHRIELGEIESVLAADPAVSAAVAAVQKSATGAARLAAYVVPAPGAAPDTAALRAALAAKLPEYMVPRDVRTLDRLPLSANGKLDRNALPPLDEQLAAARTGPAREPADETERRLLAVWREVLKQEALSVTDDFFEVGGQSFEAVRIIGAVREMFGVSLSLGSIWQERTVERVAALVREGDVHAHADPLVELRAGGAHAPLFLVHPAGGHVMCYRGLAGLLDRPVHAFQAPGVDGREAPLDSIAALAETYVARLEEVQPAGPVRLGGWSSGALIAFEMAAQLERRGRTVAGVAMIDCPAPHPGPPVDDAVLLAWFLEDLALDLPVAELVASLDGSAPDPRAQLEQVARTLRTSGRELGLDLDQLTAIYRVFLGIVRGSRRYEGAPVAADLLVVRAADGVVSEFAGHPSAHTPDWGWRALTSGTVRSERFPGTHYTLLSDATVAGLAGTIEGWLLAGETEAVVA